MYVKRHGLTLVETTVVIAIITIIVSLTLVAVQSVRESARRVKCQNNLHQLGIAITNFTQSSRVFPSLLANRGSKGDASFEQSAFVTILPELEVIVAKNDTNNIEQTPPPPILRCPSSNEFLGYRYNYGSGVRALGKLDGILRIYKGLAPSEITDGLSNTCLTAERMSGKDHSKPVGVASLPAYLTDLGFANDCMQLDTPTTFVRDVGVKWQGYQPLDLVYTHYSTPNKSHWDCQAGYLHQLITARSLHSGGAFVLFADGHVSWVGSSMDLAAWRAWGTVAGHETVSDTSP
jgi:prepilin-type processing-associated H-X9-DG protein/prepilin-type N-terminal cleavage/methylation domain-containing protein